MGGQQKPPLDKARKVCWLLATACTSPEAAGRPPGRQGWSGLGVLREMGLQGPKTLESAPALRVTPHCRGGWAPHPALLPWVTFCFQAPAEPPSRACHLHTPLSPVLLHPRSSGGKLHKGQSLSQALGQGQPVSRHCGGREHAQTPPSVAQLWGRTLGPRAETSRQGETAGPPQSQSPAPPSSLGICEFD